MKLRNHSVVTIQLRADQLAMIVNALEGKRVHHEDAERIIDQIRRVIRARETTEE